MKTLILRFSSSLLALSAIADPQAAWAGCISTETSGNGAIGEGYRVCWEPAASQSSVMMQGCKSWHWTSNDQSAKWPNRFP